MTGRSLGIAGLAIAALAATACTPATPPGPSQAGASAASAPGAIPPVWFEDVTERSGIRFTYASGHGEEYYIGEMVGGGVALFDMDGDGDLDAFFTPGGRVDAPASDQDTARLFRNRGDGTFDDVSAGSGADVPGYAMGVTAGDVDGDGDPDLFMTRYGQHVLLRNDGGGRFRDITREANLVTSSWGSSAAFVDMDRDGDLDLYVANYLDWSPAREIVCYNEMGSRDFCGPRSYQAPTTDLLFRNEGDGTFTDITASAGIDRARGNGLGVLAADFDGDGWLDIFVSNDGSPNFLWINQKDGTFVERGLLLGCAVDENGSAKAGMGISAEDLDGDDDLDLIVGNLFSETDSLFRWNGRSFEDRTRAAGLATRPQMFTRFAMIFADFDQDGCLDLFEANGRVMRHAKIWGDDPYAEPNLVFRGSCLGTFTEILPEGATASPLLGSSRGAAAGDLDGDGALDLIVVNRDGPASVLRNASPDRGRWIALRVLERSGADALGATVRLHAGGRLHRRDVRASGSYVSSMPAIIHVGLGEATVATAVEVTWVDGSRQLFGDLPAGQLATLRRSTD